MAETPTTETLVGSSPRETATKKTTRIDKNQRKAILQALAAGDPVSKVATLFGYSTQTIYYVRAQAKAARKAFSPTTADKASTLKASAFQRALEDRLAQIIQQKTTIEELLKSLRHDN